MIEILQALDPSEEIRIEHPYLSETLPVAEIELRGPLSTIPVIIVDQ